MVQALRGHDEGNSASWFCRADSDHFDQIVDCCDILVICRARYTDRLSSMIERAKTLGRTVIFDVDDLVVDPQYAHLLMATLDQDTGNEAHLDYWFGYMARLSAVLQLCDRVITTNEYLASHIRACTDKNVRIVPELHKPRAASILFRSSTPRKELHDLPATNAFIWATSVARRATTRISNSYRTRLHVCSTRIRGCISGWLAT